MATRGLYELILCFRFDLAEDRCRTHPRDVEFRCARGYTALHRLVCHRGVAVAAAAASSAARGDPILRAARSMLRAADVVAFEGLGGAAPPGDDVAGAVRLASDRGNRAMWSPLHLLCQLGAGYGEEGTEELVRCLLLLDGDGEGVRGEEKSVNDDLGDRERNSHAKCVRRARRLASLRDRQGRTPLHLLCERRVPPGDGIIDALLSVDPSLVLCRDRRGDTPLLHLARCGDGGEAARHFLRRFLSAAEGVLQSDEVPENDRFLLHGGPWSRRNLVHSAVRIPALCCPPSLIVRVVSNENSVHVREWDESGNLPIHVLAANANHRPIAKNLSDKMQMENSSIARPLVCQRNAQTGTKKAPSRDAVELSNAFSVLLRSFPESASMRNSAGMLPLQLASASGISWTGGIARLIGSFPQGLAAMDLDAALYPRIVSLAGSTCAQSGFPIGGERRNLDLMFELVKAKPSLFEYFCGKKDPPPMEEGKRVSEMIKSVWSKHLKGKHQRAEWM